VLREIKKTEEVTGKMAQYLYFAYGSNLSGKQMAQRCPEAEYLRKAVLKGYALCFRRNMKGRGVASIYKDDWIVPGALWIVSEEDLETLDRYEGHPYIYQRKTIKVNIGGGKIVKAITYIMADKFQPGLPSMEYYERIGKGYREIGLNRKYLEMALVETQFRIQRMRKKSW
jgi:gamma-glutamylcyclotransferase (GGCT)/AIG2-like uncharacterized protein YtfP